MYNVSVFWFLLIINLFYLVFSEEPLVETPDGKILGLKSVTPEGKSFFRFQGIPFAAPPLGRLRFEAPQAPLKWKGVKNCTNKNISCIQIRPYISELESEDCLILNVYTPKLPKNSSESDLAVMVYIYGGGFYIGNSTYDSYGPDFFMEYDVVIVTVNYRLGPFGFLSTEDTVIPGNYGLKDQQYALKWVKRNIKLFGGDPEKITIFGNSAGAASIVYHIVNEENQGLFRAAILSSGSALNPWAFQKQPRKVANLTVQYVNGSKITRTSLEILEFLRDLPAMDLRKASLDLLSSDPYEFHQFANGYFYSPVRDLYSSDGYVKNYIYESLETGNFSRVPLLMGITSEEILTLSRSLPFIKSILKKYDVSPELLVNGYFNVDSKEKKKEIGNLLYQLYTDGTGTLEEKVAKGIRIFSDISINNGVLKHAELASNYTDVFLYQFSYDGVMGNYPGHLEGAGAVTHTEDMNYIWQRSTQTANNVNLEKFPENDKLTHKRLLILYTNFAKYLNPTPTNDAVLQNIKWPTTNSRATNKVYLDINTNLEVKQNLKYDTYLKWNEVFLKYAVKPYTSF